MHTPETRQRNAHVIRLADAVESPAVHVLHVVPGLPPGGMELTMARLIRATESQSLRHTVICLKGDALIADQLPAPVAVHCLHSRPNDPRLPWQLWRLIRRLRPTVIHARNWGAWPDVALARLFAWRRVPLIFSFHGFAGTGPLPFRRRLAFRVLSRMTTYPLTVCEAAKSRLVDEFGWPAGKVRVIPNGVDTVRFSPRCRDVAESGRVVIGCAGSLTPVKNHALLVRAVADLVQDGINCELRIAGEGPERLAIERLAAELGIAAKVRLPGHLCDVPEFLRGLDVFALPSASEAHPNALLEAMSCGLPCVATDVGGVAEVLDAGRCGRLLPPADLEGFRNALRRFCEGAELRRSLGEAARERIMERYSLEAMVATYERLYREASTFVQRGSVGGATERCERKKPRLLHLGPMPPLTGGMATVIDGLLNSRLNNSYEVLALNTGKMTRPDRTLAEGVSAQVRLLGRLIGILRRKRIQIVHLHTCEFFGFWRDCVHALVAGVMGCRVVWHMHGARFDQWAAKQGPCRRAVIRMAFERAAAVIVLSDEWRRKLSPFAPKARWRVIPNGISMPEAPAPLPAGAARFLFLGDWTPRKGVADLVAAVSLAANDHEFRASVALAGFEKEPGQRKKLDQLVEQSGCSSRITVLGLLSGQAKDDALAEAHCLVLPSYGEGLPMAVLEAMGHGRSIIATRVGAIPELITEGQEGFLIEPGDVKALADCLTRVASDSALVSRQGTAARQRVEREYSSDVMVSRIADLYTSLS
jgi:glycosyltransferase involved in cell wall biosynthesis